MIGFNIDTMYTHPKLILSLVIVISLLAASAGTASPLTTDEVDGVTIETPVETQAEMEEIVEEAADLLQQDIRNEVGLMLTEDGDTWIVSADEEIVTGNTVVEGDAFEASDIPGIDHNVVFADSVKTETRGEQVSFDDLQSDPEKYEYELVRVTGEYSQLSYGVEVAEGEFFQQDTVAVMDTPDADTEPLPPGNVARWAAINLSDSSVGEARDEEIIDRIGNDIRTPFIDYGDTRFWMDTEAHLDVVVVPSGDGAALYVADVTPVSDSTNVDSVASGDHDGDVVSVEGDMATVSMSTKHTLLSVAQCAPDSVSNPVTGCLPVVTDAVVHGGIMHDGIPDTPEDMVIVAGISNTEQDQAIQADYRRVEVVGEVVDGEQIAPIFEGQKAIVAYDFKPVNHNHGEPPAEVDAQREQFADSMTHQMNGSGEASADGETVIEIVETDYTETFETEIQIYVTIENTGEVTAERTIHASFGGDERNQTVTLDPDEQEEIVFTRERDSGALAVYVEGERLGLAEHADRVEEDSDDDTGVFIRNVELPDSHDGEIVVEIEIENTANDAREFEITAMAVESDRGNFEQGRLEPGEEQTITVRIDQIPEDSEQTIEVKGEVHGTVEPSTSIISVLIEERAVIGGVLAVIGFLGMCLSLLTAGLRWVKIRRGVSPNMSKQMLDRYAKVMLGMFVGGLILSLLSLSTMLIAIAVLGVLVLLYVLV